MLDPRSARLAVRNLLALDVADWCQPIAAERVREWQHGSTIWERVELLSGDGDMIPCLVASPAGPTIRTVVAVHQHSGLFTVGKSEVAGLTGDPALAFGPRLVERGLRVVMPDLVGFEERTRTGPGGAAAEERSDALAREEHGSCLQAKHSRDIAVVTSWIIDTYGDESGLGIIGHSLGGQVALFNMAIDQRLTHGVISCGLGTLASFELHRIAHNPAWYVPGLAEAGDVPLLAAAMDDQRILVSAGICDPLFPIEGVRQVLEGFSNGICTAEIFDGAHELPPRVMELAISHLADTR